MAITYEPIATTTASGSVSSITFSSISGTYTDLVLIIAGSGASSGGNILLQFNGDTGTNYSTTILYGDATTAGSLNASNASSVNIGDLDSTVQSNTLISIMNYANTTTYKTALGRSNRAGTAVVSKVGLWRSTSAITSVKVFFSSGDNFTSGTTLTLYGIASA